MDSKNLEAAFCKESIKPFYESFLIYNQCNLSKVYIIYIHWRQMKTTNVNTNVKKKKVLQMEIMNVPNYQEMSKKIVSSQ